MKDSVDLGSNPTDLHQSDVVILPDASTNSLSTQELNPILEAVQEESLPSQEFTEQIPNMGSSPVNYEELHRDSQALTNNPHDSEDDGFQTITRRKNKGKLPSPQTVCSLPCAMNIRKPFKPGLSKFVPVGNVSLDMSIKTRLRVKGSGGAPLCSSSIVK